MCWVILSLSKSQASRWRGKRKVQTDFSDHDDNFPIKLLAGEGGLYLQTGVFHQVQKDGIYLFYISFRYLESLFIFPAIVNNRVFFSKKRDCMFFHRH